ncbi:N-acetylglutamate synthase, partial [Lojkania enalia]
KERQRAERNQLIKSLKESPGKRDAKNFLKHFDTPKKPESRSASKVERAHSERLYEPTKAIQDSPVFTQQPLPEQLPQETVEPLHIALVKLRQPQALDDKTLGGIALTLSQMVRLGLNIAVVVDVDEDITSDTLELSPTWENTLREQVSRIVDSLEEFNEPGAFEVGHALSYSGVHSGVSHTVHSRGRIEVKHSHLLFHPMEEGIVTVIPPIAYDANSKRVRARPDEVLLALTREFSGLSAQTAERNDVVDLGDLVEAKVKSFADKPLLDRIIILDPLGGIPSENRADGAHVFINLEAEYQSTSLGQSNPFSKIVENEMSSLLNTSTRQITCAPRQNRHFQNLEIVQQSLKLLPPSSSALIITPAEAAVSSQAPLIPTLSTGVRTRRSKNPLIHNLLTDKPMISSSLPAPLVNRSTSSTAPNPATFLKKGIPVTTIPSLPWAPPSPNNPSIELENDPRIDFPRLVDLIEDSFRRKLNVKHYLDRIRGRVAGIIIAGNYEGGAICTWETPPALPGAPHPDSPMWIPYLDKFAVLTSSQGSGGVADIVWGALTRSCFPNGLVWRSRTSNPVNKWYFERAVGMWNLPDGQWTMFWTTEGVEMSRWDAYVGVCSGVAPSWADAKAPD